MTGHMTRSVVVGVTDAYVIEDEDPDSTVDSMPATPETSVNENDSEISSVNSPSGPTIKVKERSSPDPRPTTKYSSGPKIGKAIGELTVGRWMSAARMKWTIP